MELVADVAVHGIPWFLVAVLGAEAWLARAWRRVPVGALLLFAFGLGGLVVAALGAGG